jgi:flagellar biosynthetic protein FliR
MEFLDSLALVVGPYMGSVFAILAVFTRMSAFLIIVPTFGERTLSTRSRLLAAFMLTWLMLPGVLASPLPEMSTLGGATLVFAKEATFGAFLGLMLRLFIFILQVVGNIVSQSMSISQPLGEGIATEPNTTLSTAFMLAGVTLLVTLDFHIEAFRILQDSYKVFPLGSSPDLDGFAYSLTHKAVDVFRISLSLAFPFVLLNFIYNLLLGFVNRAMPQLLVSFVGMPAMIGIGMVLLSLSIGAIMTLWLGHMRDHSTSLLGF